MQTIPYFICRTDLDNCIRDCRASTSCVEGCRKQYVCSASNPPTSNSTETDPTETEDEDDGLLDPATLDDGAMSLNALESAGCVLMASIVLALNTLGN
jgi:hypothetical protein